jgi:hypothetical protein
MKNSQLATRSNLAAPGAPGAQAFWSRSSKDGIGTAYHTGRRLWFTLSQGVVSEIYCPTVDTPTTRELHFLIIDGESFCHEEKRDLQHAVEKPERGPLAQGQRLQTKLAAALYLCSEPAKFTKTSLT